MLCGSLPFKAKLAAMVKAKTVDPAIAPPSSINPAIDRSVETAIVRACERTPEARYRSAEEFRDALEEIAEARDARRAGRRTGQAPAVEDADKDAAIEGAPVVAVAKNAERAGSRAGGSASVPPAPLGALNAVVLALALLGALATGLVLGRRMPPPPRPTAPASRPGGSPGPGARGAPVAVLPGIAGEAVALWPGYPPTAVELELARLLDGPRGAELDQRLRRVMIAARQALPSALIEGPDQVFVAPPDDGQRQRVLSTFYIRMQCESVLHVLRAIPRLRRGERPTSGIATHDLRLVGHYLAMFQPACVLALRDELRTVLAIDAPVLLAPEQESPLMVGLRLRRLDRAVGEYFRAR
jgi:hypothetical protein